MYSNGTYVGTTWKSGNIGVNPTFSGTLSQTNPQNFSVSAGGTVTIASGSSFAFSNRSRIACGGSVDGNILLSNNATTAFGLLQFGGITSSFPALKPNGTTIEARLADDSGHVSVRASRFIANTVAVSAASEVGYGGTTATTVGAAGAASALPATPVGYIIISVTGTLMKLPYYNN